MKSQQPIKQRSFRLTKSWLMFQQLIILMTYSSHSPLLVAEAVGDGTSEDLEQMFQRMEADTINFAKHMESLILPENRCSSETLNSCSEANYNGCISEMPHATCPGAENRILACGKGEEGGCSGLFDFTATKVSLAKGNFFDNIRNPSEREKDGVCHTLPGDEYIIEQRESRDATDYWNEYKVSPPWYHYGNDDGIFRILPGSPEECASGSSTFDPRIRPWYVAASSGPKDIILILDTSGSMSNYGRLSIMQEAAARVVGTLGVSDYVSVIEFNDNANHVGTSLMERADDANKKKIIEQINTLQAGGNTNFEAGFDLAFKTFKNSINNELTSGCHKAILFLTDGQITGGASAITSLMNLMTRELNQYSPGEDRPAIFTYSFGSGADSVVPKQIACNYNGIWASIDDGGDLANSMGAYYKYFAYGLSGQENADFVAWVAPYAYSTTGELGTTASVPVYDRSVDPPVLAGVVGLDFSFVAMERALGDEGEKSRDAVLERIVERSIARCPNLNLTACQLESLREYGAGDYGNAGATCGNVPDCATKPLKSPLCKDYSQSSLSYPNEIWNNDNNKGRTYEEKVCCSVGEEPRKAGTLTFDEVKDLVCEEKSDPIPMIIGIVCGVVGLVLIAFGFRFYRNRKKPASTSHATASTSHATAFPPERPMGTHNQGFHTASAFLVETPIGKESVLSASTVADPIILLPPPTAPNS